MVQIVSDYTLSHIDKFVVLPMEFGNENDIKLAVGLLSITSNIISINSIALIPNVQGNITNIEIYTLFPSEEEICGDELGVIKLLSQWELVDSGIIPDDINFVPTKLPSNFNGCFLEMFSVDIATYVILKDNITLHDEEIMYQI